MGTYRKEWDCCGSVTETEAWEPESCPLCTPDGMNATEKKNSNEMRLAFTVQIDELIDIASTYECRMELEGDFDEARRVRHAIHFARQKLCIYKYNGDYKDVEAI